MAITAYSHSAPPVQATRDYDRRIVACYCVLGVIALAALYFAAGGPGYNEAALVVMATMP